MTQFSRYWHTVRHLKPIQIYGRFWFRLVRPRPDYSPAPPLRDKTGCWRLPLRRKASLIPPDTFNFLGEAASLGAVGWDNQVFDKLWRYNLHYFDDLNAVDADKRIESHRALLSKWVLENPTGQGSGWEPYPLSLRIINWVKWILAGNVPTPEMLQSLAIQSRWLARRMEFHLLGNHLYVNAKALLFAGLFFRGAEADRWVEKGLSLLVRETPEQILPDGGQFERSPMYHALALEDLLDICNLCRTYPASVPKRWSAWVAQLPEVIDRMRRWLATMCHPDSEISFFNDAAVGIAPSPSELDGYAVSLGHSRIPHSPDTVTHLPESGYIRVQMGTMVTLLDVAPVGPDYLPGHAHADTLSFELSLLGQRFFVNSGTSCYGSGEERARQRGTAAHNTVVVDGKDSSEVWSGFRVARRARPLDLHVTHHGEAVSISCSHDGYRRLKGSPTHTRTWHFGEQQLLIEDRISGGFKHAMARFHLHPAISVLESSVMGATLQSSSKARVHISIEGGELNKEASSWHPEFGVVEPATCLSAEFHGPLLRTRINWESSL